MYYDSFVYALHAESRGVTVSQTPDSSQTEHALIRLALHVSPRPPAKP
jgi:hypothetical protein